MDTLLNNLKILSSVEVNQRLYRIGSKYVIIENTWSRSITGAFTMSSRKTTIDMISADIRLAIHILRLEFNEELARHLKSCIIGLDNLCGTYIHDHIITDQLRDLIHEILSVASDVEIFHHTMYGNHG